MFISTSLIQPNKIVVILKNRMTIFTAFTPCCVVLSFEYNATIFFFFWLKYIQYNTQHINSVSSIHNFEPLHIRSISSYNLWDIYILLKWQMFKIWNKLLSKLGVFRQCYITCYVHHHTCHTSFSGIEKKCAKLWYNPSSHKTLCLYTLIAVTKKDTSRR